jgi:hypothetical protein
MAKVGKSDWEGTFAGTHGNDEDAPIPAIREQAESNPLAPHCIWRVQIHDLFAGRLIHPMS